MLAGCITSLAPTDDTALQRVGTVVYFVAASSEVDENAGTFTVRIAMDQRLRSAREVRYELRPLTARNDSRGATEDFTGQFGSATIPAGRRFVDIQIPIVDDAIGEGPEDFEIVLPSLGPRSRHTATIVDDECTGVNTITLVPSGADDQGPIESATADLLGLGGGCLVLEPGDYLIQGVSTLAGETFDDGITGLSLVPGISYIGYGARLVGLGGYRLAEARYSGADESEVLLLQGLEFDNTENDVLNNDESNLFLMGSTGRVVVRAEDLSLIRGRTDGIQIYKNVDFRGTDITASELKRTGIAITGGNTDVELYNFETHGNMWNRAFDVETGTADASKGGDGTHRVSVWVEDLTLGAGGFDVALREESSFFGRNVQALQPPFYLNALDSTYWLEDSTVTVGVFNASLNRIVYPGQTTFQAVQWRLTEICPTDLQCTGCDTDSCDPDSEDDRSLYAGYIYWSSASERTDQSLECNDCSFEADDNVEDSDTVYGFRTTVSDPDENNQLVISESGSATPAALDAWWDADHCDGCTLVED